MGQDNWTEYSENKCEELIEKFLNSEKRRFFWKDLFEKVGSIFCFCNPFKDCFKNSNFERCIEPSFSADSETNGGIWKDLIRGVKNLFCFRSSLEDTLKNPLERCMEPGSNYNNSNDGLGLKNTWKTEIQYLLSQKSQQERRPNPVDYRRERRNSL